MTCPRAIRGTAPAGILVGASIVGLVIAAGHASAQAPTSPPSDKAKAIASELAKFQGTWQLLSAETDGRKMPEQQARQFRVIIDDGYHSVIFGTTTIARQVKFVIDPTTSPKSTEDTITEGPNLGKKIRGIYELNGDELRSCVAAIDRARPTEFTAKAGSGQTFRQFKRISTSTISPAAEQASATDYGLFRGTWRVVSVQVGGKGQPSQSFEKTQLTFDGTDFTTVTAAGTTRGKIALDATRSPKAIDVTITDGRDKGTTFRAIYEISDDTYKLCSSFSGNGGRPKEFEAKAGSGYILQVLKRVKP
jgi:uncharacterized protein (TIGR03067 family)